MTNTGTTKDRVTTALATLATDYDITAEFSEVGDGQFMITSPDTLMVDVKNALEDTLGDMNDEVNGVLDYSIAHTDTVLSLIIH